MMTEGITHELDGLWDKEHILFFSFERRIDFKNSSIVIEAYFDDPAQTRKRFSAAGQFVETDQKNTHILKLPVPRKANNAIVILTSESEFDQLEEVLVFSEDYAPKGIRKQMDSK